MTTSNTNNNDPNQYVTNPPSTFCKIQNVISKPELNDQYGLIISYDNNKQRYNIVLCKHQTQIVSLKYDNIYIIKNHNIKDKIISQYLMIYNNIQLQQQINTIHNYILHSIVIPLFRLLHIPPNHIITPQIQYFYILVLCIMITIWYFIGITKLLFVFTITFVILSLIGNDLINHNNNIRHLFTHTLPIQYTNMIQNELPYNIGQYIVNKKPWLLRILTTLLLFFITYTLFGTPTHSRYFSLKNKTLNGSSVSSSSSSSLSWMTSSLPWSTTSGDSSNNNHKTKKNTPINLEITAQQQQQQQHYYKLGFDDATQQFEYGTSFMNFINNNMTTSDNNALQESVVVVIQDDGTTTTTSSTTSSNEDRTDQYAWKNPSTSRKYDQDPRIQDNDYNDDTITTRSLSHKKSSSSSPFSFSTIMAGFTLYRMIQPIIVISIRNGQFDIRLFLTQCLIQFRNQPWKIMIVLFSLYRIVVAFM